MDIMKNYKIEKKYNYILFLISLIVLITTILLSGCINIYERSQVHLLAFSPDGSKLISCDYEDTIQIWDINSGGELYRFCWTKTARLTTCPMNIKWLSDGERFAVMDGLNVRIYNLSNYKELWNDSGSFSYMDVSHSGKSYATNFGIWDATNYMKINKLNISSPSHLIDLSSSGEKLMYLPSNSKAPEIINSSDGKTAHSLEGIGSNITDIGSFYDFGWSLDGDTIGLLVDFKKGNEGIFYYEWDNDNHSLILNKNFSLSRGYADISPDFSRFIYANPREGNVTIYDILSGATIFTLENSEELISAVEWSPDGSKVAAGIGKGIIKVWDANTGELIQTMMTPKDHRIPT